MTTRGATPGEDWLVYLLVSEAAGRTYVGIATELPRRLAQHNGERPGGARSTRGGRPWRVACTWGFYASRADAQRAEAALKKRSGWARVDWDGAL